MEKIVEDILNCLCLEWDENIENIIEELKLKELYKTTESMGLCYSAVITDIITDFLDLYIAKIEMDVAGVRKMDMKGLVSRCDKDIFYSMVGRMDEEEDDDEPDISASSVYYNVILSQSITKRYYLYDCLRLIAEKKWGEKVAMYVGIDKKMCLLYVSKCMRSLLSCNQKNKFLKDNFGSLIFEDTDVAQIPELYYITGTRYKKLYIRESVDFIWRQLYTRKACINYEEAQIIFVLVVLKLLTEYSRNPQYSSLKEIIKKDWLEFRPLLIIDRSLEIYQGLVEAEIIANDNYEGIVSLWENLKIDCLIVEFELFKALENLSKAINVKFDVDVCIKDDMIKLTISNIDTSNERVINELMWLQMVINIFMDGNPYYCVTEYINLVCLLFIKNHKSEDMDWLTDVQTLCGVNEFIGEIDASLYDSDDEVVRALKEIIKTPNKYKEYENKALFEAWLENLHAIVKRTLSEYEYL